MARLTGAALDLAPRLPDAAIDALDRAIAAGLSLVGPFALGPLVRRRMSAAGVYRPGAERAYFRHAALHLADALHVFHQAAEPIEAPGAAPAASDAILELARERIALDASVGRLREAAAQGRGVVLAGPHACQFLLVLARLGREVPLTVYLRHSRHDVGRRAKLAWCRAAGIDVIAEPSRAGDPAARAARLAEALRQGRALVITPDIPQKRGGGVPVRLFGRTMALPAGPASLAQLTGAPMLPVMYRAAPSRRVDPGRMQPCVVIHEPIAVPPAAKHRGWRAESLRIMQQQWADRFEAFLRAAPELWYHWLDNRWGRVFDGDEKYASACDAE